MKSKIRYKSICKGLRMVVLLMVLSCGLTGCGLTDLCEELVLKSILMTKDGYERYQQAKESGQTVYEPKVEPEAPQEPSVVETAAETAGETVTKAAEEASDKDLDGLWAGRIRIDSDNYYYYSQLAGTEKELYESFLSGILNHKETIELDCSDDELVYATYNKILADHPEIFWVHDGYNYVESLTKTTITPKYTYSISDTERKMLEILDATDAALDAMGADQLVTDYDKTKAVFEYVINTVDYVLDSPDNQNLYSSLVNHVSVCAGYTRETQYLLQQMGVQAIYVSGDVVDRGSHAWNIVRCDGRYYMTDSTFGDSDYEDSEAKEMMPEALNCDYSFLCCSADELMRFRTVNENNYDLPECSSSDLNYYKMIGRYYDAYDESMLEDMRDSLRNGEIYWTCQFSNVNAYNDFLAALEDSVYLQEALEILGLSQVKGYSSYNDNTYTVSCWYYQ